LRKRERTYVVALRPGQHTLPDSQHNILCDCWLISDETSDVRAVDAVVHQSWIREESVERLGGLSHHIESEEIGVVEFDQLVRGEFPGDCCSREGRKVSSKVVLIGERRRRRRDQHFRFVFEPSLS